MSAVTAGPRTREMHVSSDRRRWPGLPPLIGLALIAALMPVRSNWAAGIVLVGLCLTVPGVLLLRALRVPGRAVDGYPVFVPVASIGLLIIAGVGTDLLGPRFGIHHPLHGETTGLVTLGLSLVLWLVGLPSSGAAALPWRRLLAAPGALLPLVLPLIAATGALLLSHGHGPAVARIGQGLVGVTLMAALAMAPRLSRGQVAMLLFSCALAAEWAFSLRGQEVVGFDIATEIGIAQHTQAAGIWHTMHPGDAYGAMLSVTILPSVLASLTGVSPLIAFKLVFPILTALLPVSVFLVAERFLRRPFAVGAAGLLVIQAYFFQLIPQLARQEIGLLFFAALAAALIEGRIRLLSRTLLIGLLAAGLVVSHYSSTYLAIPIVVFAFVVSLAMRELRFSGIALGMLAACVVLIAGAGLWYGTVTHSSSNLTSFSSSLVHNGLNLLPNSGSNPISSYLNGTQGKNITATSFQQAAVNDYAGRASYIHPLAAAHDPRYALAPAIMNVPKPRYPLVDAGLQYVTVLFNELMLLFGVIGGAMMAFGRRRTPYIRQIGVLALGTVGILVLIRFSGTVSTAYNQTRALGQSLLLLALPAAWAMERIFDRLGRLRLIAGTLLVLAFGVMFADSSSLTHLLTGGGTLLNLSQNGEDFQRQYMTPAELAGAAWASGASQRKLLYADPYGQLRLNDATGAVALNDVTPLTLDHQAWLYGSRTNILLDAARGRAGGVAATYAWPNAYLNRYYDTVYTDGDTKVYHR